MLIDFAWWSYLILIIVSLTTGGTYLWWLLWVLKKNRHLSEKDKKIISMPYVCDMMIYFGVSLSASIAFYARIIVLNGTYEQLTNLAQSWQWQIRMWPTIIPLFLVGWRAISRIIRSLPKD